VAFRHTKKAVMVMIIERIKIMVGSLRMRIL
jgi:hypothetical protein